MSLAHMQRGATKAATQLSAAAAEAAASAAAKVAPRAATAIAVAAAAAAAAAAAKQPVASGQRPAASSHFSVHVRAVGAGRFFQSLRRCARCKQGSHCALTCMESELGAKSQYRCRPPCRQIGLSCRCAGPVSGLRRRPPARPAGSGRINAHPLPSPP